MGIFGNQAGRLLRESWAGPGELAEEMYSILTSQEPVQIDSPLQITNPPGSTDPPLTINNAGQTQTMIQINHVPLPSYQFGEIPPVPPLPDIGGLTITTVAPDGTISTGGPPTSGGGGGKPPATKPGGGGLPGKVVSGSGDTYLVQLYANGLDGTFTTVSVKQLQIAKDETIPAGTWAIVTQVGSAYYMQVPVWLGGTTT